MSSSVSLYTTGNMIQATCIYAGNTTGTPDEPAGFPKQNLVDANPDTYWKPTTSTAVREIKVDLASAKDVDAIVMWWQNYDATNHSGDTYDVLSSTDNSIWTSRGTGTFNDFNGSTLLIKDISQLSARYWQFEFDPVGTTFFLSEFFVCRKWTIAQGAQWPENDLTTFQNRDVTAAGGRSFVQAVNSNKGEEFSRTYMLDETKMQALRDAFEDSRGSRFPLILQEGSLSSAARLVRFAQNSLDQNEIDYQVYQPTVRFVTVPYIPSGSTY